MPANCASTSPDPSSGIVSRRELDQRQERVGHIAFVAQPMAYPDDDVARPLVARIPPRAHGATATNRGSPPCAAPDPYLSVNGLSRLTSSSRATCRPRVRSSRQASSKCQTIGSGAVGVAGAGSSQWIPVDWQPTIAMKARSRRRVRSSKSLKRIHGRREATQAITSVGSDRRVDSALTSSAYSFPVSLRR